MLKYTRPLGASLFAAACLLGACRSDNKKGPDSTALGADTTLSRDLALAGRDTTVQPQLKDVPANTPSAPEPAAPTRRTETRAREHTRQRETARSESRPAREAPPTPTIRTTPSGNTETSNPGAAANPSAAGGGAVGMIPAGATLSSHSNTQVCTNTSQVGDHVTATLDNAVSGSNGAIIPAGATVNLTVTRLKKSSNTNDPIVMEFAVNSVTFGGRTYPIDASVQSASVDRVKDGSTSSDAKKVAIGAVGGAILGHIFGHSTKATVIGGAAGAAAGAATAAATTSYQGCVQSGGAIVVRLNSAATIRV